MYKKTRLPNGLRVITHDMKERDSISLGFWVGIGGRYEQDKIKGAAHFLEHIVFKGSAKYDCDEIKTNIEGIGGTLNAFTSEEQTCFYAKIPSQHLEQTFDVLADMVFFPKIAQKDVTKEKTVILEEIKMYHDLPQYYVLELLDELMWPNHPLGKSLAGTVKSVSAMSNKALRDFHRTHYASQNMVVAACGHLQHERIVRLVKQKLGKIPSESKGDYLKVRTAQSAPKVCFHKRPIEQMHLALGMPGFDEHKEDRYALSLLSVILGGNMSSRLFVEVREKRGLAYSISAMAKSLHDTGVFMVRAGVDNRKVVEAIDVILKELRKVARDGVGQGEFNRARDYLLGQFLLGLEDTMEHMLWLGESIVAKDEMRTLNSLINKFKRIKKSDVKRVAKVVLNKNCFNLAMVGPVKDEQEKKIRQLMGVV